MALRRAVPEACPREEATMSMLEVSPEINRGFVDFYRTVSAEGALDRKRKS